MLPLSRPKQRQEAKELQELVLETAKKFLGEEDPRTLTYVVNLASTLQELGQFEKAEELAERVVEKRKALLGAGHPDTHTAMSFLALLCAEQYKLEKGKSLLVQTTRHLPP